ncbi:hypothetical protein TRVA0_010S02168 [Trichomonascus vanleenenianus]|uniref:threonine--tRNA ligase MST1 n=1 Tax=Trichomonascus vanleenenianus TaxID=2268995 RepID=UPI003ECA0766
MFRPLLKRTPVRAVPGLVRWNHHGGVPEYIEIAQQQKLYMIDKSTPGSVFFLPHGARLFEKLVDFMKAQQRRFGFQQVITPLIYKNELWKTSGHWTHYKDDMFEVSSGHEEEADFSLKPMNCPGHCVMFGRHDHSFRELPVRYADFSPLHRNEASGALTGLTRVRKFHQDDGHIFCQHSQVQGEIESCLKLIQTTYEIFGLGQFRLALSTRPDKFAGDVELWNQAEAGLKEALQKSGKPWSINEKDGAFYGPKIDIMVTDNNGKEHQTATIQLDFQLPKSFELKYMDAESKGATPVLIHRAIFGSLERFMALLIDHYKGKWPFWLNPRQAVVIPVASRHHDYAQKVVSELSGVGGETTANSFFHVELSAQDETVGTRVRRALADGYSYIIMIGDKEMDANKIALRSREDRKLDVLPVEEVRSKFEQLERQHQ